MTALKAAWTFHTGDVSDGRDGGSKSKFEVTPLFNDTLYTSTPFNRVIALNPEDGTERWSYDPKIDRKRRYSESLVSRGVSAWEDKSPPAPRRASAGYAAQPEGNDDLARRCRRRELGKCIGG